RVSYAASARARRLYRIAILPVQRPGRRGPAPIFASSKLSQVRVGSPSMLEHVGSFRLPTCRAAKVCRPMGMLENMFQHTHGYRHQVPLAGARRTAGRSAAFELLAERAEHGQAPRGDALVRPPTGSPLTH